MCEPVAYRKDVKKWFVIILTMKQNIIKEKSKKIPKGS